MTHASHRLLIVDDNIVDRERIRRLLGADFETREAATAAEAIEAVSVADVDCVLLDYRLPDLDGIAVLDQLAGSGIPVVMLTGQGDEMIAVEAMKHGAKDYLSKGGLDALSLKRAVASAVEKETLRRRVAQQREELEAHIAELAARDAERRLILGQLPAIVWTTDTELRYTSVAGGARFSDADEGALVGHPVGFFLDEPRRRELFEAHTRALEGAPTSFELSFGDRYVSGHVEALRGPTGATRGVVGVALDVSENRALELQLRRAQKMEALGNLAGGVAHDFNNLLTAIISFAGFIREEIPDGDPIASDLHEITTAAERGARLVRQLLAFSQKQMVAPKVVDIGEVVHELLPMLRRVLGEDVNVQLDRDEDLWLTKIDPGSLEQIVVNMAVNARDAMPRGGHLSIGVRNTTLAEGLGTQTREGLPAGDYVVLSVSDEGEGIPPEIRERVFEPFFTTKPVGAGTGLGLATCYGIARQAGGSITVYSEVGHGSTFRVYLPRTGELRSATAPPTPGVGAGGDETILVLEDEPQVRALVVRILRARGYDVLEAKDAREAAELAARHGARIRLVLTDVVMPGASGPEVVALIRPRVPNARVLYMSGYADDAIRRRGLLDGSAPMLEKPFTPEGLARMVRVVLDQQ